MGVRIAIGAALALLAFWYWFMDEPADPFARQPAEKILADPKMPPDSHEDEAALVTPRVPTHEEDEARARKTKPPPSPCPPGDPMCGGL